MLSIGYMHTLPTSCIRKSLLYKFILISITFFGSIVLKPFQRCVNCEESHFKKKIITPIKGHDLKHLIVVSIGPLNHQIIDIPICKYKQ